MDYDENDSADARMRAFGRGRWEALVIRFGLRDPVRGKRIRESMPRKQSASPDVSAEKSALLCSLGILFMMIGLASSMMDDTGPIKLSQAVPWYARFTLCMICAFTCLLMSGWLSLSQFAAVSKLMSNLPKVKFEFPKKEGEK